MSECRCAHCEDVRANAKTEPEPPSIYSGPRAYYIGDTGIPDNPVTSAHPITADRFSRLAEVLDAD